MASVPTYIRAPNFTLTDSPDSPYHPWLGTIIADPLIPTRSLSKLPTSPAKIVSVKESESSYTRSSGRSLDASIWANFLQFVSANVGGERSKDTSVTYSMSGGLETRYFEPSDDEVVARITAEPKVRAAMSAGLWGHSPVYMITGIKVAKGFSVSTSSTRTDGGHVGGSAPVTPAGEVSVGGQIGGEKRSGREDFSRMADGVEIVFAYQLHVIAEKGWREKSKRIVSGIHESKAAFLSREEDNQVDTEEWETSLAYKDDLMLDDEAMDDVQTLELRGENAEEDMCILLVSADGSL